MTAPMDLTPEPTPYAAPASAPAKRPRRLAVAAVAVLAVGAGAFGVLALSAGDGAESPEAAVEAMFDAMDHEDVIGVLEALEPNERDILRPAVDGLSEEARRTEVASADLDLRKVDGIDLQVEGLTYTTEQLGDGITAVDLTGGSVSTSSDLDRLPFGPTVRRILDADEEAERGDIDRSESGQVDLDGTRLVARQSGGGWHVSALYSIAEQVRLDADPAEAVPDFGNGVPAQGAASPEAAVREAVAAATDLDVRRLIELTPPGEMAVLHDYGPMLVDAADRSRDDDFQGPSVDELELEVADGPDGTKVVSASRFEVVDADEYGSTTWTYDGSCTSITSEYDYKEESSDFGYAEGEYEEYGEVTEFPNELGPAEEPFEAGPSEGSDGPESEILTSEAEPDVYEVCDGDGQAVFSPYLLFTGYGAGGGLVRVVTEEHDGQWFVSPTRSIVETVLGGIRELSVDDARRAARVWAGDWWAAEPDGFWEACGVDRPADDASSDEGEQAADECYENLPDDYEGSSYGGYGYGFGSSDDDGYDEYESEEYDPADDPSYACYEIEDDAAIETCLADLVASGDIDVSELASFRCDRVYDGIADDADAATWEAAEKAYEQCYEAATTGGGEPSVPGEPAPTAPPPGSMTPTDPQAAPTPLLPDAAPRTSAPETATTGPPAVPGTAPASTTTTAPASGSFGAPGG